LHTDQLAERGAEIGDERGDPWEHDPGPTTASGWAAVFAETPNYRGLGWAVLGREGFGWHHGPMFFRGRLDGSAKVVLVGQGGAQDESLSHRSFTGGIGVRMQHLLRHLGPNPSVSEQRSRTLPPPRQSARRGRSSVEP
jgi:hypothetical protein